MTSRKLKVVIKLPSSADIILSTMATMTATTLTFKDKQTDSQTDGQTD